MKPNLIHSERNIMDVQSTRYWMHRGPDQLLSSGMIVFDSLRDSAVIVAEKRARYGRERNGADTHVYEVFAQWIKYGLLEE